MRPPNIPLLIPVRSKNPQKVRDAFRASRIGVSGRPHEIQMDEGGEWKNEVWTHLPSERVIKLQFQGVGAHHWILGRSNGPARGIRNLLAAIGRYSGNQVLAAAQWQIRPTRWRLDSLR